MWQRLLTIALGVWLLIAPAIIPTTEATRIMERVIAPVVIWVGVLAMRAVTRPLRAINILAAIALLIAPWLAPITTAQQWNTQVAGWLLLALTIPQGAMRQRIGGGWLAIIRQRTRQARVTPARLT